MNVDYSAHERQYRELRQKDDRMGWGTTQEKQEQIEQFEKILRDVVLPEGSKIVELGCGAAELAIHFARKGFNLSGIDISPTAIDWGRQNAVKEGVAIELHCGDVRELPFEDSSIDLVLDACLLHCIIGDDRAATIGEVWRVLKLGGLFAGITMCGPIEDILHEQFDIVDNCLCRNGHALRYIGDSDAILSEIKSAGFEIVRYDILEVDANGTMVYLAEKRNET